MVAYYIICKTVDFGILHLDVGGDAAAVAHDAAMLCGKLVGKRVGERATEPSGLRRE